MTMSCDSATFGLCLRDPVPFIDGSFDFLMLMLFWPELERERAALTLALPLGVYWMLP